MINPQQFLYFLYILYRFRWTPICLNGSTKTPSSYHLYVLFMQLYRKPLLLWCVFYFLNSRSRDKPHRAPVFCFTQGSGSLPLRLPVFGQVKRASVKRSDLYTLARQSPGVSSTTKRTLSAPSLEVRKKLIWKGFRVALRPSRAAERNDHTITSERERPVRAPFYPKLTVSARDCEWRTKAAHASNAITIASTSHNARHCTRSADRGLDRNLPDLHYQQ